MIQIKRQAGDNWMDQVRKEITGMIVMTTYNSRTYKVDDLVFDKNPVSAKFVKNDREMSLVEYYKQNHDIDIKDPRQPLISCLPSVRDRRAGRLDKLLLIPELCALTGLTEQMRSDRQLKQEIERLSRLAPNDRSNNLMKFIRTVSNNEEVKKEMTEWNLRFDPNLVELKGRLLDCERIYMYNDDQNSAKDFQQKTGDFSKEMRSKRLFLPCSISKWIIISTARDRKLVDEFANTLKRVCIPMGINLMGPRIEMLENDRTSTFVAACQRLQSPCELAVFVVPNNNKYRYDAIKKVCYCENSMPSQVVATRTLKKPGLMSICTKIGIQMACKMGAEPWSLRIPVGSH